MVSRQSHIHKGGCQTSCPILPHPQAFGHMFWPGPMRNMRAPFCHGKARIFFTHCSHIYLRLLHFEQIQNMQHTHCRLASEALWVQLVAVLVSVAVAGSSSSAPGSKKKAGAHASGHLTSGCCLACVHSGLANAWLKAMRDGMPHIGKVVDVCSRLLASLRLCPSKILSNISNNITAR